MTRPAGGAPHVVHVHLSSGHQMRCLMSAEDARGLADELAAEDGPTFVRIPSAYSELLVYRRAQIIGIRLHHGEQQDAEAAHERLADALNRHTTYRGDAESALDQIGGLAPPVVDVVVSWIEEAAARPPK